MTIWYNLTNLEASFKSFLLAENISPVTLKNYLSDLRHFFGWLTSARTDMNTSELAYPPRVTIEAGRRGRVEIGPIGLITFESISSYKSYLVDNSIPNKTVNRRLSTLRRFCSFCITQGWMKENPAKKLANVSNICHPELVSGSGSDKQISTCLPSGRNEFGMTDDSKTSEVEWVDALDDFQSDLQKQGLDSHTITSCLNDVEEILSI